MVLKEKSASELGKQLLSALPKLTEKDLLPEVNSLVIDENGNLHPKAGVGAYSVNIEYAGYSLSFEVNKDAHSNVMLRVGCVLSPIPYTAESPERRAAFFRALHEARLTGLGRFAVTPSSRLYLHDRLSFPGAQVTASWLVAQITSICLYLRPVLDMFGPGDTAKAA